MTSLMKRLPGLLGALLVTCAAQAQTFPSKPVVLMVPYPVGGVSDVIARTLSGTLARHLGQPVVVENLGGASGGIARLVQMITINPLVMLARKDLPAANGDELMAYAKRAAAGGKPLTYASVGPGSFYHLLGEHMSSVTGVPMVHVPYKGGAPAVQDLLAGQVDIFMTPNGKGQVQLVEEGKLKAPAVLSAGRQQLFSKVPTLDESGALKGFVFDIWAGYFVHRNTPEAIVTVLHKALGEVANDATVRSQLEAQAMVVPSPRPLDELARLYRDNTAQMRTIARSMNLQPQ
jgi:tripartite-type tricarboxylate transporter receptor subunit TctC